MRNNREITGYDMKKRIQILPLVSWLIVIATTVALYTLLVENLFSTPIKWLSLFFVFLAEVALCAKFIFGNHSILLNTNGITGVLYLVIVLILSFVYINAAEPNIKWFITIHLSLLAILVIVDLTIFNFDKNSSLNDQTIKRTIEKNRSLFLLVDSIITEHPNSELKKELIELSEDLRYANHTKLSGDEDELFSKLEEIREDIKDTNKREEVSEKIKTVKALVKTRSSYIKENQRGKI